jgi:hypothetical protein
VKYNILWLKVDFSKKNKKFGFKKKISVLEVEIGRNGPGISGVKILHYLQKDIAQTFQQ